VVVLESDRSRTHGGRFGCLPEQSSRNGSRSPGWEPYAFGDRRSCRSGPSQCSKWDVRGLRGRCRARGQ
jgi:hypothetical protein